MVAQAERLKISITEENREIKALQEAAYIKGYMTAELRERERRKKARERKKRKRYFLTQKLYGVAMLILTAVLGQRRALRLPGGGLQQLPVERGHGRWRVVRV